MSEDDTQVSAGPRDASVLPGMPVEGETFAGRYHIERLLGRGGMGMVYLAVQAPLDRPVALKVLRPPSEPSLDPQFYSRFLREAEAAARLQHPNTITIYDFGNTDEGLPYIVMEYLEGRDLRQLLASEWPFSMERTLHVASQVCKSLMDAHDKGMIHRDLKPANVLLVKRDDDEDFVKVFDFGLVKFRDEDQDLTQAGIFLGSPRYTFPEALDSKAVVDERADIYSAGILIYSMVAGMPPFNGEPMAVLSAHLNEPPRPMCQVDPRACSCAPLEAVVARCLRKDPRDRYQSMRELQVALREVSRLLETGDESLELDPSAGWAAWETEFDEEERTTQRDLDVVEPAPEGVGLSLRRAMMAILVVLLASAAIMTLRTEDPKPVLAPAPVEPVPFREIGVSLHSDEASIEVSYMAMDGRWRPLGTISDELRERWNSGSEEPWWTAEVEADQQVLSVLLVGSAGPGRRLELPIVNGQVRFDAAIGEEAPGSQVGSTEVPLLPASQIVPTPADPDAAREPEAGTGEANREAEKPSEISPGYKDNPY